MPRTFEQVIAEQRTNIGKHFRSARGVEPVAAVVHPQAIYIEAAGVAANLRAALDDRDVETASSELIGGSQTGRAGAEHDDGNRWRHCSDRTG